jgi:hypothetical protein
MYGHRADTQTPPGETKMDTKTNVAAICPDCGQNFKALLSQSEIDNLSESDSEPFALMCQACIDYDLAVDYARRVKEGILPC